MTKKKPKFVKTDSHKYSKLGVRRKKKQVYRKPKGRDNKIRLNMKGHIKKVKVGFRTEKTNRGLIDGKTRMMIYKVEDLKTMSKDQIGVVASIGEKKKIEIAECAIKHNIKMQNLNPKKYLERTEIKRKISKEEKAKKREKKRREKKKAKETEKKKEEKEIAKGEKEIAEKITEKTDKEKGKLEKEEKEIVESAVKKAEKAVDKIKKETNGAKGK